ncbi:MAG: choice-of-anchor Q domain-containing protein [Candidatus Neomarinimicrobiota bacterium]
MVQPGTYTGPDHGDHPVVEFTGRNVVIESVAGPATTIIDGEGERTAISMNYQDGLESGLAGYSSSTKIIGFTIKNGDEDYPLVDIEGPSYTSSSSNRVPWNPVFENCRFMNSTVAHSLSSWQQDRTVITIYRASPTFDGCVFRGLKTTNDGGTGSSNFYAPIRMKGNEGYFSSNGSYIVQDSVVYRPKFKNCVIAGNSNELDSESTNTGSSFYGGAISVGINSSPYFENTRIDSNKIEAGGDYQGTAPNLYTGSFGYSNSYGGAVHIDRGPKNNPPIRFVNSSISYNTINGTYVWGGGVFTRFGQTHFINSVLVQNKANSKYLRSTSSTSTSYHGSARGGAIYYDLLASFGDNPNYTSKDPEIQVINSTIADNQVNPVSTSTPANNYYGAGIYRYASNYDAVIFNSIMYGNTTSTGNVTPSTVNMSTAGSGWGTSNSEVDYSLIQYASDAGIDEDNILSSDPNFSAGATVYTLSAASPAIGAGTSVFENITTPVYDYLNTGRPVPTGSSPDLGAFENSLSTTPYPDSPSGLTVSSVNNNTVTLSWTAGSETDLVRYRIYKGTSANAATLADSAGASFTSKSIGGLTNGTTYYFRVVVMDADGYVSGYSNEVSGAPEYKGPVWYVNDSANSGGDGSPALPFRNIEDGIDAASAGDTVMVLPGTYDGNGNRELNFQAVNTDGQVTSHKNIVLMSRDGAATTILDGRSSHVFTLRYSNNQFVNDTSLQIIGFTITASSGGDINYNNGMGGVVHIQGSEGSNPQVNGVTFKNCVFADTDHDRTVNNNYGAMSIIYMDQAHLRLINCVIRDNSSIGYGSSDGIIMMDEAQYSDNTLYIEGCKIVRNTVKATNGTARGVIYTDGDKLTIVNSIIANNTVEHTSNAQGGALTLEYGGSYSIINSTITGNEIDGSTNTYSNGSAIHVSNASSSNNCHLTIFNSIIYGNSGAEHEIYLSSNFGSSSSYYEYSFSYSILAGIDGDDYGDGNLDVNPVFADTNFTLSSSSLAIGAGASTTIDAEDNDIVAPALDYSGNARPSPAGSRPDMGAQENSLAVTPYPDAPANIAGTAGHISATVSWSAPSADDVSKYYVYQADSSSSGWSSFSVVDTITGLTNTSASITGLTNNTRYTFYVTSIDTSNYQSTASEQIKLTPFYNGPVWYVDDGSGAGAHEGSPDDPFREVQDAIDVASAGDTVLVLPGTYDRPDDQQLEFVTSNSDGTTSGKNIVLMSRDGAATTFLDGENKRVFNIEDQTDTTLQIIGFTITASNGGEDDGSGSVVKIQGYQLWNNNSQSTYYTSGVTFKNCVFTMFDSGDLEAASDWEQAAVYIDISNTVFDNCEFTNITVDNPSSGNTSYGGAVLLKGGTLLFNRSKLTNITLKKTGQVGGNISGAVLAVDSYGSADVTLVNTIVANNSLSYASISNFYPSGGVISYNSGSGHLKLINSTVVNNQTTTINDGLIYEHTGSVIGMTDVNSDGNSPHLTIFNSIIHSNTIVTRAGSQTETTTNNGQFAIYDNQNDGSEVYASYSIIGGDDDLSGDDILNLVPEFLDSTFALHPRSSAIGAGVAEGEDALGNIINAPQIDFAGNVRPNPAGSSPDVGAWENSLAVSPYPDSPSDLFATEDNQSVLLLWSATDARDVVQYRIYSSADSTNFTLVDSTTGLYSTEGTVTGLTNNERYWFYVTSVDTAGYESSPSMQIVATPTYLGPVWYVDAANGSGSGEGSIADAFREIQDAIDAADEGDTVMVLPGTYDRNADQELQFAVENQNTGSITPKNIVLFARGGPDSTILDGEDNKQLFTIDTQNDTTLKIIGFTIQNGGGDVGGAAVSVAGVYVGQTNGNDNYNPSGAVFENCVIKDSDSQSPAIVVENGAGAIFRNCIIKNNRNHNNGSGQLDGAGIKVQQQGKLILDRTKVLDNYTDNTGNGGEFHRGAGVYADNSAIYVINSLIAGNYTASWNNGSGNYGSGLYAWNAELAIINSTITGNQGIVNQASGSGTALEIGGSDGEQIVIFNSIIAGNINRNTGGGGIVPSAVQTYIQQNSGQYVAITNSIFEGGSSESFFDEDEYCYDFDPLFEDSLGTLSAYSSAIGKGGASIEDVDENDILHPVIDLYGNPRPNPAGSSPDIGAYEHVLSEPKRLVYYINDTNGNNNNDGLTSATALKTIASALNKSSNRDTLELAAGTYNGVNNRNLNMQGLTRIVRSTSGAATTIIDCQNLGTAFVFNNGESDSVHISGLTIINGNGSNGGAISITGADPVFENMIFRDNSGAGNGGAIYLNDSQSSFTNCVFDGNQSADGGAMYVDGGTITLDHCTFINNTSDDTTGISIVSSGAVEMLNSIYWGNHDMDEEASVAFSNVMGGFDGEGNMNGRPGFTDAENGNVTLLDWSPMIGVARSINVVAADIAGVARPDTANPDMGAYENSLHAPSAYTSVTWHVDTTGTDEVIYSNFSASTGSFESIDWVMDHVLEGDSVIIHPGYYDHGFSNWGKSAHLRGSNLNPADVWIGEEIQFSGGSSSLHMLSIHADAGDGVVVSAGSIDISYVLIDSVSGEAIALSGAADATISNVTLYGNEYALVDSSTGSVSVVNTIIWGNTNAVAGDPTITYSNVQGGYTGTGNVNVDPLFLNASEKDFALNILSPCIDAGDTSSTYDADNTVVDMGAFPRQRVLLSGDSQGDITVSADTVVIITDDFTVSENDTLELDAGAELFFSPGVSLTVSGALDAEGNEDGGAISFLPTHPDSTWGGLTVTGDRGRTNHNVYSYIQISGVEAASVPLTVDGDAILNHITIAGNDNATSLSVASGTVDLNYSILEGQVDGTVNSVGSFTSSTDQFTDYANDDFTLLAAAAGIDVDTNKVDPDYTYGDAGAYYHNQSSYPVTSITVLQPAVGDTVLASPDTSTTIGLTSNIQLFNTYGRYKTKGSVTWASVNNTGSFSVVSTDSTNLNGIISNQYITSTVSGSYNSFTVSADDASSTSGFYLVEPGTPDSVAVAVPSATMTQLDSLTFSANVYDQFSNSVRLGEHVVWSINSVSGSGDGYRLSSDTTATDAVGNATVILYTDPTDNTLSVGDQVTVTANAGSGSHVSSVVIIIPSDIYNLTLDEGLTSEELGVSADTAFIDFYTALVDTFDNPLENVEVVWEVVTGSGTGESLSAGTSNTNAQGVASTRLNTNTISGTEYQVRCWVTESSLLNAFGSFESLANNTSNVSSTITATNNRSNISTIRSLSNSIKQDISGKSSSFIRSNEIEVDSRPGQFVPAQIVSSSSVERNINRVAAYDLDDTSAVVLVWPGVTASLSNVPQVAQDLELNDQFGFTLDAQDQFGNLVRNNTPVSWEVSPSSNNVTIVSQDNATTSGQAAIALEVASSATWDFSFKIIATVEGISDTTGSYRIDDVTAPASVSALSISPSSWTSNNTFSLTWTNPSEHSGVAGAHYEIDGESSEYVAGSGIQTLSFSMPANDSRTIKLWLQDNADNDDESTAMMVTAKWDDTSPQTFDLIKPLAGWYNQTEYRFEWESSGDATSGISHYMFSLNGGSETAEISPDSTGFSPAFGLAQGSHSWTVTAYDSAGNAMETSNPQTISVDHTPPGITHNPVQEATENTAVVINAVFTEDGSGQSGIDKAELYYRRGGESNWQPPVDMSTLSSYQIASAYSTSSGIEYYLYSEDVAGNITKKPVDGFTSISVTIPNGLASTDRWPTGVPNGSDASSYQLWSFPGNPTSSSPVNLIVDDMPDAAFDNTKWRAFAYAGSGAWTEFEQLSALNSGESYFILIKDPGFSINTGQTYTIETNQPYQINLTSGDWTFIGNPFDFSVPLSSVLTQDSTSLSGDPNFYTYDGGSWTNASSLEPWGGYIYKSSSASSIFINPGNGGGGLLGRSVADSEIILEDNEWLVNISARNGLGRDPFNEVGLLQGRNGHL